MRNSQKFYLRKSDGILIRSFNTATELVEYCTVLGLKHRDIQITDNYGVEVSYLAASLAVQSAAEKNPHFTYNPDGSVYAFLNFEPVKYHYRGQTAYRTVADPA
jgi:hypothetical protein